jgi:hypothetical protein
MPNPNYGRQRPALFWPFLLIGVGVILLLSNLNILPGNAFAIIWRFWPLLLVVIGLDLLLGRRSALGSIISSLVALIMFGGVLALVVFADQVPFLQDLEIGQLKQEALDVPLGEFDSATINIDWPSGPAFLYPLSDSSNLLEGQINYHGDLIFEQNADGRHLEVELDSRTPGFYVPASDSSEQDRSWRIGLHPAVELDLILDAGSGSSEYDLRELNIESFEVDAGSGSMIITLPARGQPTGQIDGGSGNIVLILPEQMAAQIQLDGGSGAFRASSRFSRSDAGDEDDDETVWQTADFSRADHQLMLTIDQGSGSISIE